MEKQKKSAWKSYAAGTVLAIVMLYELIDDIRHWAPHGDQGVVSGFVSAVIGIYALISSIRRWRAQNRSGFIAAILLLAFAALVFWISCTIPFCPECDGGVDSALMRWILADKL